MSRTLSGVACGFKKLDLKKSSTFFEIKMSAAGKGRIYFQTSIFVATVVAINKVWVPSGYN